MNQNANFRTGLIGIGTVSLFLLTISLLALLSSCGSDSTDKAADANRKRIESQGVAISQSAKDEAVSMADNLVDLAGMAHTARLLSEEALAKATNPQVKNFARRALETTRQTDTELIQVARQLSLQLPTAPAKAGQNRVDDLKKTSPGTAFDLTYLEEMENVSKKAAAVAEDLEDDGTTEPVRAFGKKNRKRLKDQQTAANQLTNALN